MPLRLRGGRAPFVAIATFPPFQRGNLPRRRKRVLFSVILNEVKNPTEELTVHIFLTWVAVYFACAQYDSPYAVIILLTLSYSVPF